MTMVIAPHAGQPTEGPPRTHLLCNGRYAVMVTASGAGYSRWRDLAVTRWREDVTCDPWGGFIFVKDATSGRTWSAGYQPTALEPDSYEVEFHEHRVRITRRDGNIITSSDIVVTAHDDAEVRRVSITNTGGESREFELTSYAEIVLTTPDADAAHPAFAKMFVRTEFVATDGLLLATRRHREPNETSMWAAHFTVLEGTAVGGLQFETDRARFLGRGRGVRDAVSIVDPQALSGTVGTVLDPIFALRQSVVVAPGETARVAFWTLVAPSREEALLMAGRYRAAHSFDDALAGADVQARALIDRLGIDLESAQQFQRIANRVLYADGSWRGASDILLRNTCGPAALWAHGISGDRPIVLARLGAGGLALARQLLLAHEYWRAKQLAVDLVFVTDGAQTASSDIQAFLDESIGAAPNPRGVFVLRGDGLAAADRELLQTAARAGFDSAHGTLAAQLDASQVLPRRPTPRPKTPARHEAAVDADRPRLSLQYFNGLGGFAPHGREYVTVLDAGRRPPAPWVNVIANPHFGFQVSTDGAGSTWSQNARENQLTPWSNDPVSDPPSEAIYIRDDDSGDLWSATPLPVRRNTGTYVVRHGFGYTRFESKIEGIELDLVQFVPLAEPVKISRLTIVNRSAAVRHLSVTHFVDWVLGNQRSRTAPFIVTETDPVTAALLARNPWRSEFQARVAFIDMAGRQTHCTGDRGEFIGRLGSLSAPLALTGETRLSNRVGGGLDPCGALQTRITLAPGETTELGFFLGEGESREVAISLVQRVRGLDLDQTLRLVTDYWEQTLGALQVKTPDRSVDILLNGWLLYQTLACRVWARTGFYQSSGAYGFRDQLQDVMALCVSRPNLAREHILRAAGRQFAAGDVQHWWLPTSGQGVKTRVSDDRVWLAFVVAHYLDVTADPSVLDERLPFLAGPPLRPDQQEIFEAPALTATTATLFEHCVLALESSFALGSHGLPLFGTGDWNDGMNRVGAAGRGESVWMGWFLHATLLKFAKLVEGRGDMARAAAWRRHSLALSDAIERNAWDGEWYKRGYYDDGSPLGSAASDECQIDAIAQSWAVISGGGNAVRAARAMSMVDSRLVSRSEGLVKLFTPAFDHSSHDPGYIKAYPPGLRENGGQYSHAAMWTNLAFALLGDGDRAWEVFAILNPINHANSAAGAERYKVEPYVVCADVYAAPGHVGRGGWTWYTGSAGWMYRTAMESMLGINVRGNSLVISPCIPRSWKGFEVIHRHGSACYFVSIVNPAGVSRGIVAAVLDGRDLPPDPCTVDLVDDGTSHQVVVTLG